MVATTLSVGDVGIIGADTEDNGNPQRDSITFILLKPIGSGTVIYFTDRAWNGTVFAAASAGEGTFTYSTLVDLPAGTVITISQAQLTAAGINLSDLGETIYAYQGTSANAPTRFLHAVELGDGNTVFDASLVNTGLVAGTSAVALNTDNAEFGTRTHNIQLSELFGQINNRTDWVQNDNSPQDGTAAGSPVLTAPDAQIWVGGSGAGEAIVTINLDATYSAGTLGYQIVQAFQNEANLFHPSDITLDTVEDKYFFVDSDGNGNNRIIQGSISQLLANPGGALTTTILYTNAGAGATGIIQSLSVDTINNKIYFDVGTTGSGSTINRINYNTVGQTPTVLATLGPDHYVTQMAIDFTRGEVFVATSQVSSVFGTDAIFQNYVYRANAGSALALSTAGSLTFAELPFNPDDTGQTGEGSPLPGEAFPVEFGSIRGIDVDPVSHALIIVTGSIILDNDGNGATTYTGRIVRYALDANPTGNITTLFQQTGTPGQAGTGPRGLLYHVEADAATGRYYVVDESGLNADPGDASVWTGSLTVPGTPTLVGVVANINGLGARGLEILHAATLTGTNLAPTITETAGNPSADPAVVAVANAFTANDVDSAGSATQQLAGAQVRISAGFQSGTGHQDVLSISGALPAGITAVYNATTGVLTLSGISTFADYQAALAQVRFTVQGDNPTNFGANGTRTLSFSVFDGALYSDEVTATVTVVGVNDAPVNTVGGTTTLNEDASATALTGISIFDVDADPAAAIMTVTFAVARGTISLNTGVVGGVTAGQITAGASGTNTITVQATQNAINATLANATGLTYTPTANVNGPDALTITSNDGGASGNDPGLTGTGTSEQDTDTKAITVTAVNDAPVASGAAAMAVILEDATPAGETVGALFGANFSDATDQVAGGSSANILAGIVVTNNPASANGVWQFSVNGGMSWVAITTGMTPATGQALSATALVRFLPATNFNGTAPTLTATLVDSSFGALTSGTTVNAGTTGNTTSFSAASVVLSQTVTAVNDAPVNTVGGTLILNEDASATALTGISIADVDANPSSAVMTVTLSVARGTLTIATGVAGGVTGANVVSGQGTATITLSATQNQVNATLANSAGLTYTPTANVNGPDALTITTNDGGATGLDPGLTGTATSEEDTDTKTISVTAINDAPIATGSATAATIFEDLASASGQTVAALFTANFSDALDTVPGGSTAHTLAGIVVTGNPVSANGVWQYFDGTIWVNIPTGISATNGFAIAASNALRFSPATNFNGPAQTLTATLVDSSGGALTTGVTVNASVTGASTRFSAASVTLSQNVASANDAPTSTGLQGDAATTTEPAGAGSIMPNVKIDVGGNATIADVDNANFSGGSLRLAITGGLVAAQDQLVIDTAAATTVSVTAGTVSVGGTAIGTVTGGGAGGSDLVIALNANASPTLVQTLVRAINFANTGGDNPTSGLRTITTTLVDGGGTANGGADTRVLTSTVNVVAADDAAVAVGDVNSVLENGIITGASVFGNDSDPDGPALVISAVNGVAGNVGTAITLASGATITVRADGTYDYNTNGAFAALVDAATAAATGAINSQAFDQFSYTLAGGNTVFVNVTVNGVQSAGDQLLGSPGNSVLTGTPGVDVFNLTLGGADTVTGNNSDDAFNFGATFDAFDTVDGGPGTNDQVGLFGNYSGGIVLGPNTLRNVELLAALPGSGAGYNITSDDGNVAAGQELNIFGGNLLADQPFRFDGRAELDGRFRMFGGLGADTFFGGALDDGFYFGPGKWGAGDSVVGGGGTNDQLALDGNYTLSIGTTADVETLILLAGPVGSPNSFNITLADPWTAAATTKTVWGLNVTTNMTIDGSGESNGNLIFFGGQGRDTLTGGSGADAIYGGGGGDALRGNGGADIFRYDNLTDSFGITDTTRDRILDFTSGVDRIDLSRIDAIAGGADDAFTFIGNSAFSNVAGQLRYVDNGGGIFIVEGDVDGDGIADFSVSLTTSPPAGPTPFDFIL